MNYVARRERAPMTRTNFLLIFDRATGDLSHREVGSNSTAAMKLLEAEERAVIPADRDRIEVVLIGAESIDAIRVTHPHYFNKERGEDSLTQLERAANEARPA